MLFFFLNQCLTDRIWCEPGNRFKFGSVKNQNLLYKKFFLVIISFDYYCKVNVDFIFEELDMSSKPCNITQLVEKRKEISHGNGGSK